MKFIRFTLSVLSVLLLISNFCLAEQVETEPLVKTKLEQVKELREQNLENGGKPALSQWSGSKETSIAESGGKMFSGLALCIGVLLIGTSLYKRFSGKSFNTKEGRMRILEKMPLTPKTAVVLFEVRGKEYLAAVGGESVSFANSQHPQPLSKGFDFKLQEACAENKTVSIT